MIYISFLLIIQLYLILSVLYKEYLEKKPGFDDQRVANYIADMNDTLKSKIQDLRKPFRALKNKLRDAGEEVDEDYIIDECTIKYLKENDL